MGPLDQEEMVIVLGLVWRHFRNYLAAVLGIRPVCEFCAARAEDVELFWFTGRGGLVEGLWLCVPCNEHPPWMVRVRRDQDPPMDRCTKILSPAEERERAVTDAWRTAPGVVFCGRPAVEVVGSATLCAPHAEECK